MDNPKFETQDNQYEFPYHYLASMNEETPQIKKTLGWGFEYLSYMNEVLFEIGNLKYNNILDVGCGDGYLLNHLETDSKKLGIDLSQNAIIFANAFAKDAKFEIRDLLTLEEKYDLISLIENQNISEVVTAGLINLFINFYSSIISFLK